MNLSNIKSDIDLLCGTTSATYPDASKVRNINIAYQDVARLIWESAAGWQFDDSNSTTLPLAKTSMVHGQQDYTLPATTQRVESVIAKDADGNWQKLTQFDIHDVNVALPEYFETPGMPKYYDLVGRSIMLYPTPSSAYATLASGLGVYVNREVTEFAVTASSATPGFASAFHRILSYAAAIDFAQDQNDIQRFITQKDRLEKGLVRFYAKRNEDYTQEIKPQTKIWRKYV